MLTDEEKAYLRGLDDGERMMSDLINLKFIENQSHWRVRIVALFAKLMGVLIHVEGIPLGSNRSRKSQALGAVGETAPPGQVAGRCEGSLHN